MDVTTCACAGLIEALPNPPAVAGVTQGEQTFDVVDPITGETVGTFDALKSSAKLFNLGGNFVELLVTNTAGPVGTAAGNIPPVGSVIATYNDRNWGWYYSAMPSPSGDVLSFKILTPFGDIPIRTQV